jgi:gluconokinase
LEGICFALKNILEIIEASTVLIIQLNVSGGFVHSKTWMQMLANVSGKKICLEQTEDASSLGAALFYMKAVNIINDYSSIIPDINVMIEPIENNLTVYEKYYSVFKTLYGPLRDSMHQLHDISD